MRRRSRLHAAARKCWQKGWSRRCSGQDIALEIVALPFQWQPHTALFKSALAWRLLDLRTANGIPVDRIIATSFPRAAQHPTKVVWLVHQYRQVYDWDGTPFSEFTALAQDRATREQLFTLDRLRVGEAHASFAISKNVAARLQRFNALDATPLYPPPRLTGRFARARHRRLYVVCRTP